jgi:hypothetical protein
MFSRLMSIIKPGDRRKERRVKVRLNAELGGIGGRLTDLSLGGFGFYPNAEGLEIGDELMAVLSPDNMPEIEIPCRLVGGDQEGMVLCVAFIKVEPEHFEPLQSVITQQAVGHGEKTPG